MSKCQSCGAGLRPDADQCQYCGTAVTRTKAVPEVEVEDMVARMQQAQAMLDAMTPAPMRIMNLLVFAGAAVIILIVALMMLTMMFGR